MIVDKQNFKQLQKEGGGIFRAISSSATIEYGYKEIKFGSVLNLYAMKNGVFADITFGKKVYINYESINDAQVSGGKLIIKLTENSELKEIVFKINKNIEKIYNTIRQNSNLGYKDIEVNEEISHSAIEHSKIKKESSGGMTCPKCKSHNIQIIKNDVNMKKSTSINLNPLKPFTLFNHKKKEKVSKGKIGLAVMTGGTSLAFTGIKNKKHLEVFCTDCGYRWRTK